MAPTDFCDTMGLGDSGVFFIRHMSVTYEWVTYDASCHDVFLFSIKSRSNQSIVFIPSGKIQPRDSVS